MKCYRLILILLLSSIALNLCAQRKKPRRQTKPVAVATPVDPRIEQMRMNTQQVVFIDSMLITRDTYMREIHLAQEAGSYKSCSELFSTIGTEHMAYLNEIKTLCYYAKGDTADNTRLYSRDFIERQAVNEHELEELFENNVRDHLESPFMMPDGQTLYFAAKGSESIGGFDIFVTRYSPERRRFLKPENLGMPFNSTGNEYFFAIDEYSNLGWLVTDRRQGNDTVCIYVFIPPTLYSSYDSDTYTKEQIQHLADITCIADTWADEPTVQQALARLRQLQQGPSATSQAIANEADIQFVINDRIVYHSTRDFRASGNADRYRELQEMQRKHEEMARIVNATRQRYQSATAAQQSTLRQQLLADERAYEQLTRDIQRKIKQIRKIENEFINN